MGAPYEHVAAVRLRFNEGAFTGMAANFGARHRSDLPPPAGATRVATLEIDFVVPLNRWEKVSGRRNTTREQWNEPETASCYWGATSAADSWASGARKDERP